MTKHGSYGTCERCGHSLQTVNSFVMAGHRVRYLGCRSCGWRPPLGAKLVEKLGKGSNSVLVSITT